MIMLNILKRNRKLIFKHFHNFKNIKKIPKNNNRKQQYYFQNHKMY